MIEHYIENRTGSNEEIVGNLIMPATFYENVFKYGMFFYYIIRPFLKEERRRVGNIYLPT